MLKRKNNLIKSLAAGALLFATSAMMSQEMNIAKWKPIFEREIKGDNERVIVPSKYKTFRIDENFKDLLFTAPHENSVAMQNSNVVVELPMPDGTVQKFRIVEAPVMAAELAAQVPQIKTFNAMGVDVPGTYAKLDYTEFGFHAMIFSPEGRIFIDPYSRNNTQDYITYYTRDFSKIQANRMIPECGATNLSETGNTERLATPPPSVMANIFAGATLRTYRFAVGCTGEYAIAATGVGAPTFAQILSVVTTTVNRVDGVYETEAAIRLVLVANENLILFGNATTDPYTGNNNANTLITESQTVINGNIGTANYDIGHTFSTGGGGLAGLGVVCMNGQKARGITGSPAPVGDAYDIDYVAHEVGHQFRGNHSYNQCSGNATQNAGTMVEPGGGVTIMGYAGICAAADNIATNSIAYFHTISFDEIMTFSNTGGGNACPVATSTGNNPPVVTGSGNYTIPRSTPFTLTGSATDPNGDALTYSWEQIDNNSTPHAVGTASPYFRSLVPTTSPSRTFPRLATVLTGATSNLGEYLPATAGTLNFRLTARDNKMGGGGVHYAGNTVTIASTGPFAVTAPNTAVTWASSSAQTVTWSVASSNAAPVNCANVKISLSTDGGNTFPTVIFASTPNDGTQAITVPPQATTITTCRIKVEAVGNIFFDISNVNFTITASASPIAGVAITQSAGSNPMCPGASATFSATPTNGGTTPAYQWQVNGANVGTNSNTYTTTTLTNGQVVTCIMTSNLGGVVGNPATSNAITMVVGSTVPSVTIAGPTVICAGASTTYTATPVNGGGGPTYQWQVNAVNAGTNSATFNTSTLTNGQAVTCIMTSNAGCQATPTVTSNTITVTVNSASALPFVQNFEGTFPPAGWVVENADAPSAAWGGAGAKGLVTRPAVANTGSAVGCAAIEFYNYNTDTTQVDNLLSVPVNLTGATAPKMTFKRSYKYYNDATNPSNYHDELKIYISTDCGATYGSYVYFKKGVQLASNGTNNAAHTPAVAADWDTDTIDLSAYINQSVIVKFEAINRYGNNLYLDDININSTVAAIPVANFTSAITKCAGQAIAFTDASTNTPTSWAWTTNPTAGVTINTATSQNPTITFTTAGTYTVSLISTNASGPSTSYTQAVVVNAIPAAPTAGSNTPVCTGNTINLTANTIAGATYAWTGPSAFTSALEDPTRATATVAMAGTYSVTATVAGCTSTFGTTAVVVNATPAAPTAGSNTPVCTGNTINLTGNTIAGATYAWTGPSAFTSALEDPTRATATVAMAGTYSVTATVAGCTSTFGTTAVVVNATPAAPTAGSNTPVCAGSTINLTSNTIAGATYAWTGPSAFTSALEDPTRASATAGMAGTYSVTATVAGCTSAFGTTAVVVNATPSAPTAGSNTPVCAGSTINLTSNTIAGATYAWTGPSAFTSALEDPTRASATAGMAGTYSVTATVAGCTSAFGTTAVVVNATPAAPTAGSNTPVCTGNTINLTANTIAGATYAWTGPSAFTSALEDPTRATATVAMAGTYSVTATVAGCTSAFGTTAVVVNATPAAPTAGSNTPVCTGNTINLTANTIAGATYEWTGPSAFTSALEDPTRATATVAMAGTYSVTATVAGCTSAFGTTAVVVNATPAAPTAGSNTPVCTGNTINLNSNTIAGATYAWTGPSAFTSALEDPTRASATAGMAGTYSVTATVAGCTSPVGTTAVVVNTTPAAPTAGSNTPVCSGSTINLTANTIAGATYAWTGPSAFISALEDPTRATATAAMAGTYSVTATVAGCASAFGTTAVVVNASPNVTATSAPLSGIVCSGTSVTLTGGGASTYTWTAGVTNATSFTPVVGTITYTVTGTAANGCTGTATQVVTVNALPTVTVNSPSTCSGVATTLTGGGASSYSWSTSQTGGSISVSPTSNASYTVTGTDANGCVNTAVSNVTVTSAPNVTVNSITICAGQSATLTGNGATTFSWNTGDNTAAITVNPTGTTSYTVTGSNGPGCQNTAVATVTVNTPPTVSTNSSASTTVCNGVAVTLTATGASTYSWNTGDLTDIITVNPAATTTYIATGTDVNGCSGTSSITVNVFVTNTPTVSQVGNTLTASGAVSYQWYLDGNILPGETNSTITATQNGTYTVETVDANGCTATSAGTLVSGIGIKETSSSAAQVSIYPNPSTGHFTVSAVLNHNNEYTTQLTNVIGQVIYSETVRNISTFKKQFTTADLKTGVYFFIITDQNGANSVSKVIIE